MFEYYYLIKRNLFWRPKAQGYTSRAGEAGIYTADEVRRWGYPRVSKTHNDCVYIQPVPFGVIIHPEKLYDGSPAS